MNKYIPAEKLIAKIKKRIKEHKKSLKKDITLISEAMLKGSLGAYESIERFTTSLQQDKDVLELCSRSWWEDIGWIMIPPSVTLKGIESLLETVRRKIKWNEENGIKEQLNMGEVSDGYHTFNELYYYRMLYNAAFFNLLPKDWVHKSKKYHTGEECFGGGWFIVMANLPTGQISNHYELKDWDLFKVPEKEIADEWDGHTPQEAADRLRKYLQQEKPAMIQWTGNNLKEVIDFTGKSPRFGEWFKSWEEYENYVHSHNDILKLFCEDGSHYEVPVGAWIVKTPDGYNVPSVARFIHVKHEYPEVDLDKEYAEFVEADPVYSKLVNGIVGKAIARHFYELSKARKEK